MNRLKGFFKAETEKYQQKYLGSSEAPKGPASPNLTQLHQVDTNKLCFEAHPTPPPPPSPSERPVQLKNVVELGNVTSLTTHIRRDLGFAGQIGQHVLLSYGDSLYADANLNCDTFRGMSSNSVALATHDPVKVVDSKLNAQGWPEQFVPVNGAWGEEMSTHSVGITNVIETNGQAGEGVVFTLLNHRPTGVNHILGAGIANVKLSGHPTPIPMAQRSQPWMWNGETEPWWGDVGAVRTGEWVYVYGHKKDNPWVYLARVKIHEIQRIECYEYWHGMTKGWSNERLIGDSVGEEQSVFWQINQGQVIWSPYYERFLFVFCDNFWSSTVRLRHAPAPEGPWSADIDIYKCPPAIEGGTCYSAAPQPHFDLTGKTLVISFTNHPNWIQAVRAEFE